MKEITSEIQGFDEVVATGQEAKVDIPLTELKLDDVVIDRKTIQQVELSDGKVELETVTLNEDVLSKELQYSKYSYPPSFRTVVNELFPLDFKEDYLGQKYRDPEVSRRYRNAKCKQHKEVEDFLYSCGYNPEQALNVKWVQHESWKTGKLITPIRKKAVAKIAKKMHSGYLGWNSARAIRTLLEYVLCMESPEVFKDFIKLDKSGILFKSGRLKSTKYPLKNYQPLLNRVAKESYFEAVFVDDPNFRQYHGGRDFYNVRKLTKVIDKDGYALNRACFNILSNIHLDFIHNSQDLNERHYIYQKFIRQDEVAAEIYKNRLESSVDFNEMGEFIDISKELRDVLRSEVKSFNEVIDMASSYLDTALPHYINYLKEGRIALIDWMINRGKVPTDMLTVTETTVEENESYSLHDRNSVVVHALLALAKEVQDRKRRLDDFEYLIDAYKGVEDNVSYVAEKLNNNGYLSTKRLLDTRVTDEDESMNYYETKSYSAIEHPLFQIKNAVAVQAALSEISSIIFL